MPSKKPTDEPMAHCINDYISRLNLLAIADVSEAVINQQINQLYGMNSVLAYFYLDEDFIVNMRRHLEILSQSRFKKSADFKLNAKNFKVYLMRYKAEQEA